MRIGIDCRTYGSSHGYMGKYIEKFIAYLEQNEDENKYVLFFGEWDFCEFHSKSPRFRIVKTSRKIGSLSEQMFFPWEISKENLDSMFFTHPNTPLFYKKKIILLVPDLVSYFYPEKRMKWSFVRYWKTFLLRNNIGKAHMVIAFSETLKRDIIEIFDTSEEKIRVIPPMHTAEKNSRSIDENESNQFLVKEGISEKYILSVWEMREYKNIPRLLQAYSLLLQETGSSTDLVLVGKEDPLYHEIRSTIIRLGLQSRVHIYNMLDDATMEILYRNASLFILASLYEGSELSILPPLTQRIPIACSLLPSIVSAVPKDAAVFFRPMSITEMVESMKKALWNSRFEQKEKDMSEHSITSVSEKIRDTFSL